jgi:4-hydroxy-3-methylbut-2-enyl diphosphate reductase
MRISAAAVFILSTSVAGFRQTHQPAFLAPNVGSVRPHSRTALSSTTEDVEAVVKKQPTKKEERLRMMKSERFHRKGFKEVREGVEDSMTQQYQSSIVKDLKASNYLLEKDGVKVYLAKVRCFERVLLENNIISNGTSQGRRFLGFLIASFLRSKDFGFCWGVERSIALAYEAVEHFPGKKVHITNELIHNPEVNDRLTEMNVNLLEKLGGGKKNFEVVEDGDVVILPAFGASFEEMDFLDKKVRESSDRTLCARAKALTGNPFACRTSKLSTRPALGCRRCGTLWTSIRGKD